MKRETGWLGSHLIQLEVAFRRNGQIKAVNQAFHLVFPVVLVGTLADMIRKTWLASTGYYFQTLHVGDWLMQRTVLKHYLSLLSAGTLGLVALIMAFAVSYYLVAPVTKRTTDRLMVGVVAVTGLKFFNVDRLTLLNGQPIQWLSNNLGISGILVGILVGLVVGDGYRWGIRHWLLADERLGQTMTIASIWLLVLAAGGLAWTLTQTGSLNATFLSLARWPFPLPHHLPGLLGFSLLTGLCQWLGILGPVASVGGQSVEAAQNLAAVLIHAGWQLPQPITIHTVVDVYTNFGGPGMMLGLLFAIYLGHSNAAQRRVGLACLLPTLGNFNAPLMVGLPVVLRPILGIPFLVTPVVCSLLSWTCLHLHWIPAVAYPIANGTPGILQGFLGTGGNLAALALAVAELLISVLIYYPFIKWSRLAGEVAQHAEETSR